MAFLELKAGCFGAVLFQEEKGSLSFMHPPCPFVNWEKDLQVFSYSSLRGGHENLKCLKIKFIRGDIG